MAVVEEEAATVRTMFELCAKHAYGGRKIANQLAEVGRLDREGKKFHYSTIQKILANTIYIGIMRCGETRSPVLPELVIVERSVFDRAQKVKAQNTATYDQRREVPAKTEGQNLLSGNTYCGHCGGKIFNSTRTDGHYHAGCGRRPKYKRVYKCYNRTQHKGVCDGQTTYTAETVDKEINKILLKLFANTKALRQEDVIKREFKKVLGEITRKKKEAEKLLCSKQKERKKLDAHILDALAGKGKIGAEHLQRLLNDVEQDVITATETIEACDRQLREQQALVEKIKEEREQILQWADIYENADIETKRLVAAYVIERVTIRKEYELEVELRISKEQFEKGL